MKVFLYTLFLVHAVCAFKPPTIEVEDHQVQEHGSIGRFVELKEKDNLVLKCAGRFEDLKFNFPKMDEHVGYSQENFEERIEEYIDENFGDTILSIKNVQESDTGTYSCNSMEHSSLNDTIHVFVAGSNTFVKLNSIGFMYDEGEVMIPCKTTKFLEKNDIELYANDALIKSASKNYDPRSGFKLTKKMYDTKPIQNVPFDCRYKKDPTQEVEYLITEKEPNASDDDYRFYMEKNMDWPYVGYNFTVTCNLAYNGSAGNFHPFYNKVHAECPQCSPEEGSHAFADRNRRHGSLISVVVRVGSLELEDSGAYRCIWNQEGREEKVIEEYIHVAPKKAQIKIVERSTQIVRLKEGTPFSLSALFAIYPTEGEAFQAKWSRMYNSSIKEGLQSETVINDGHRTVSTEKVGDGSFSEKLEIGSSAVTANMSGTYILSISLLDTVQVVQWEVAIENAVPDVQIAIREPSSFIVFNQQFYPPNTHLHIDCVSISIPPGDVVFEQRADKNSEFEPIDTNLLDEVGGTFENGYIWNATLNNNIELRCSSTKHGKTVSAKKSIYIADEAPSAYSKIIKSDKSTTTEDPKTLYEGDNVELTCSVPHAADWTVFWRFEDIIYDSEASIEGNSKLVVLPLRNVTARSSGRYICVVKNGDSEKHLEKHVTVEKISRPHHTNADSRVAVVVEYDEKFEIDCNMVGNPAPVYQWFKNGNPYTHGDLEGSVLRVSRARAEDEGQFHCLATNRAGSTSNIIDVQVKGAPKGSSFAFWIIAFLTVIFVFVVACLAYKLHISKRITKQKDIALNNLYEHMMKNNPGPPPEDIKGLPINERVYYLPYNTELEIIRENLEIEERIGSGQFGVVCKGLLQMADPKSQIEYKSRLPVAVKTANNRYNIEQQKMLADELKVMCAIGRHPNVLALVGACTTNMRKGQLFLVTEYLEGGNLLDFLVNHRDSFIDELVDDDDEGGAIDASYMVPNSATKKKYKENGKHEEHDLLLSTNDARICTSDLISFGMQIANGMEYLASIPCVHRDLACRNILLTKNKIIRVADFGLAKRHPNKSYYVTKNTKETPIPIRWMALEAIMEMRYTHKSDVWSFAICLYEIFSLGGLPYPGIPSNQVTQHLRNGGRNTQPKYCHDDIFKIMKRCWSEKEKDRPTFSECVQFFKHHMSIKSQQLLEHVDDLLRLETEHQEKLDEWVAQSRPDIYGTSFAKPPKKPTDERYFVVESHA